MITNSAAMNQPNIMDGFDFKSEKREDCDKINNEYENIVVTKSKKAKSIMKNS